MLGVLRRTSAEASRAHLAWGGLRVHSVSDASARRRCNSSRGVNIVKCMDRPQYLGDLDQSWLTLAHAMISTCPRVCPLGPGRPPLWPQLHIGDLFVVSACFSAAAEGNIAYSGHPRLMFCPSFRSVLSSSSGVAHQRRLQAICIPTPVSAAECRGPTKSSSACSCPSSRLHFSDPSYTCHHFTPRRKPCRQWISSTTQRC